VSGDREEIERIKKNMRRDRLMDDVLRMARKARGTDEDRAMAEAELDAEGWTPPAVTPVAPSQQGERRAPGRPAWTQPTFWAAYREAQDRAGAAATDKEIAAQMGFEVQQLQRLVRRHNRPPRRTGPG
jgi:hypothetical protein